MPTLATDADATAAEASTWAPPERAVDWVRRDLFDRRRPPGPVPALADVDTDRVAVSYRAVTEFARVHGDAADDARAGVLDTLDALAESAWSKRDPRGYLVVYAEGYRLTLTPDLTRVVTYRTIHRVRTLDEVRDRVPSPYRGPVLTVAAVAAGAIGERADRLVVPSSTLTAWCVAAGEPRHKVRPDVRRVVRDADGWTPVIHSRDDGRPGHARGWVTGVTGPDGRIWVLRVRGDGMRVQSLTPDTDSPMTV